MENTNEKKEVIDTTVETMIGKTGLTIKDIFNTASSRLFAIYVMDVEHNAIIPLKTSKEMESYGKQPSLDWDVTVDEVINKFIAPKFRIAASAVFSRRAVASKLNSMEQHSEVILERVNGQWNNINVLPLKVDEEGCKVALCTFVDITVVKKRSEEMEAQLAAVKKSMNGISKTFTMFAKESFKQVMKFDVQTGETSKLTFDGGEIKETSLPSWYTFFEKVFSMIHPDDKENAMRVLSVENIKKINPGSKISTIYRANLEGGKYSWYRTTVQVLEDEPSMAFALTSNVNDELIQSLDYMKNLIL